MLHTEPVALVLNRHFGHSIGIVPIAHKDAGRIPEVVIDVVTRGGNLSQRSGKIGPLAYQQDCTQGYLVAVGIRMFEGLMVVDAIAGVAVTACIHIILIHHDGVDDVLVLVHNSLEPRLRRHTECTEHHDSRE